MECRYFTHPETVRGEKLTPPPGEQAFKKANDYECMKDFPQLPHTPYLLPPPPTPLPTDICEPQNA